MRIEPGGSGQTGGPEAGVRYESGRLAAGDSTLRTGEYRDAYSFQGRRGQFVTVDLRSADLDPYLIVIDPSGKHHENDDHEGDSHRSLVAYELPEDGAYRVLVTSHGSGETGAYDLRIQIGTGAAATASAGPRVERGRLAAGDDTLRSIAGWKMEGLSNQEIAGHLGRSVGTVERKLRLIRKMWEREVGP